MNSTAGLRSMGGGSGVEQRLVMGDRWEGVEEGVCAAVWAGVCTGERSRSES